MQIRLMSMKSYKAFVASYHYLENIIMAFSDSRRTILERYYAIDSISCQSQD